MTTSAGSSIEQLIDTLKQALRDAGATRCFEDYAVVAPASDDIVASLEAFLERPLPSDLNAWLRHLDFELPLRGAYDTTPPSNILENLRQTSEIDFSEHLTKVESWGDERWDDGQLARVYWSPKWVGIAVDGCGNEICVDLAPGPRGKNGQILAMEFQDGQGPYLSGFADLKDLLAQHIEAVREGRYEIDEEGAIEYED